ncbi:glycosyltransferase family 2 protein [Candidatus Bathyarchaeota archaeon]|nr:glycosyltransferase family 2 protein [Candidatus Bathyarchaeota archaeon]
MTIIAEDRLTPTKHRTLSIIVPIHNEEEILEEQASKLVAYARQLTDEFEILLLENGSTDNTVNIARKLQERFSTIRVKRLERADYSTAVIEGVKAANGDFSIVTGIDYVDLGVLGRCFRALKDSDVVICSKNKGLDQRSLLSRLTNRYYNALVRLLFGLKYSDVEGYHGYNTKKIRTIVADIETKAHLCNLWILVKARKVGLRVAEVPFVVYERRKSKFMKISRLPYLATISLVEFIKLKRKGY